MEYMTVFIKPHLPKCFFEIIVQEYDVHAISYMANIKEYDGF